MKKHLLTTAIVLCSILAQAQLKFQRTYGGSGDEEARAISTTNDGGYIVGGYTTSFGNGDKDAYVLKIDGVGDVQWTKTFGGPADDEITNIQQTFDGGYIMSGYKGSVANFYVTKMDAAGSIEFTRNHAAFTWNATDSRVLQTSDSNYVAVSTTGSLGNLHLEITKFDNSGNTLWQSSFGNAHGGGFAELPSGELIIISGSGTFGAGGPTPNDIVLTKTSSSGTILWSKIIATNNDDGAYNIKILPTGNFFITGASWLSNMGDLNIVLMETDSGGNIIWSKKYGETGKQYLSRFGTVDANQGFITDLSDYSPSTNSNMGLLKVNASGSVLWSKKYGGLGEDNCYSFAQASDNGYVLAGYTKSFGVQGKDIYLVKTDSQGNSNCNETSFLISNSDWIASETAITITPYVPIPLASSNVQTNSVNTKDSVICTTVGIKEVTAVNLYHVYPNPTNNQVRIDFNETVDNLTLRVLNSLGAITYSQRLNRVQQYHLQLPEANGIYFIQLIGADGTVQNVKIVKE